MLTRRFVLSAATALTVAACASAPTQSQVSEDIQLVAAGAQTVLASIQALPANQQPAPATETQIASALQYIATNAPTLASLTPPVSPVPNVLSTIENDLTTIANLAEPFWPESTSIGSLLLALVTLGSLVYQEITGTVSAKLKASAMTPAQARVIIRAATAK